MGCLLYCKSVSAEPICTSVFCQIQLFWRGLLRLFDKPVCYDDSFPDIEKIQNSCNITAKLTAQFEDSIVKMRGIWQAKFYALFFQEFHQSY